MSDELESLKRTARRWKRAAIVSWVVLALVVTGAATTVTVQYQQAAEAARAAEKAAREAQEAAKRQSEAAHEASETKLAESRKEHDMLLYFQALSRAQEELKQDDLKKARGLLKDLRGK